MSQESAVPLTVAEFYASQAEVMLAQYKNIEQLLGATQDYTGPGTHCEALLREFIRRNVSMGIAADKGFVLGRHAIDKETSRHCPEIDILIHDVLHYRPLFRLDEFVIVQQEAVLGMIQVKRSLVTNECRSGIRNVMLAKRHLIDLASTRGKKTGGVVAQLPGWQTLKAVVSAVVGFSDTPKTHDVLKERLEEAYGDGDFGPPAYDDYQKRWMMPDFVGTLQSCFVIAASPGGHMNVKEFWAMPSYENGTNTALQALLAQLTSVIWRYSGSHLAGAVMPPFKFPDEMKAVERFSFPNPPVATAPATPAPP